jgi:hypothetical protein
MWPGLAAIVKSGCAWTTLKVTRTEWDSVPLVPVTVMFPVAPWVPAIIVRVEVAVPLRGRLTVLGLMDHTLHCGEGQRGEGEVCSEIVPLKPFTLERVIVEVAVEPAGIERLVGFAVIVKSGGGDDETTVKATLTLCDRLPLVPVTVTSQLLGGVPVVETKVRVELADPPSESLTLDELRPQPGHETQRGGGEVVRFTVPLKPLILVNMIKDFAEEPATTV